MTDLVAELKRRIGQQTAMCVDDYDRGELDGLRQGLALLEADPLYKQRAALATLADQARGYLSNPPAHDTPEWDRALVDALLAAFPKETPP